MSKPNKDLIKSIVNSLKNATVLEIVENLFLQVERCAQATEQPKTKKTPHEPEQIHSENF